MVTMLAVAIPVALVVGLSLGALGGGGSILTVPALVYLLGTEPAVAVTASLIIVGVTALMGVLAHRRRGSVKVAQGLAFGLVGIAGAVAGTRMSLAVPPDILLVAFSGLMLVVATLMLTRRRVPAGAVAGPGRPDSSWDAPIVGFRPRFVCACPRAARVVVAATVVGLVTGFFGVGGGFLIVPALVLALDFPMSAAVGTSLLVIAVNSGTSLIARVGNGVSLDWPLVGTFTVVAVIGSLVGARIATRARPESLQTGFAALLAGVGVYTAFSSVIALIS